MAQQSTRAKQPSADAVTPVGARFDLIKVLFSRPEFGLLFLLVIVFDAALLAMLARADSMTERLVAMGLFAFLNLAVLFVFWRSLPLLLQPVIPENLIKQPISPQEAERREELIYAPDATFAFGKPPLNWEYEISNVTDEVGKLLNSQLLGDGAPVPQAALGPIQPGIQVVFTERQVHSIDYRAGKTRLNGRFAIGALSETMQDGVRIFSVSKRGTMIRDVTAAHVFALQLAEMAASLRVVEVAQGSTTLDGRSSLMARGDLMLEDLDFDGAPAASAVLEVQLYVVESDDFIYVLRAHYLRSSRNATARLNEISAIIGSFRAVFPANADERARRDQEVADAMWSEVMRDMLPKVLVGKARTLLAQIQPDPVKIALTDRQVGSVTLLRDYGRAFPEFVPEDLKAALEDMHERVVQAQAGEPGRLAELIHSLQEEPALPAADAPHDGSQTSGPGQKPDLGCP